MSETKEKSAVGMGVPATETENNTTKSITDNPEKIKSEIIKSAYQHDGAVGFRTITDNSAVIEYRDGESEYRDGESEWRVFDSSDTVSFVYDIVKKLMWR